MIHKINCAVYMTPSFCFGFTDMQLARWRQQIIVLGRRAERKLHEVHSFICVVHLYFY